MLLTEQNLEYVLESVVQTLIDEEIEIDEELLDECFEEVLSEISKGLAQRYSGKANASFAKADWKAFNYSYKAGEHKVAARQAFDNKARKYWLKAAERDQKVANKNIFIVNKRKKGMELADKKLYGGAKIRVKD